MGGFLGIGGSSAKTDRGNQLAATQGEWNIFNYGMPTGQAQQATGSNVLGSSLQPVNEAQDYFSNLLKAGRTDTAMRSAPAVNAALAGGDAQRMQNAEFGTGRSGGTAAANANAGAATTGNIDNIINTNLVQGQAQGAAGLNQAGALKAGIGSDFLANALQLLGLGAHANDQILSNATQSRPISYQIGQQTAGGIGAAIGQLATSWPQLAAAFGA